MSRFMHERFFNSEAECRQVTEFESLPGHPPFASFTVYGNAEQPARLDLYKSAKPAHNERPVAIYVRTEGALALQTAAP